MNPRDRKLLYVWKGRYIHSPGQPFEGFGDFYFEDSGWAFHAWPRFFRRNGGD